MNKEELKELAATLNGIADGKAWEREGIVGQGYFSEPVWPNDPIHYIKQGAAIRLKPWQLPQPPDGMQWHRDDWTEEMLPEGYRPSLLDEAGDGEVSNDCGKTWKVDGNPSMPVRKWYGNFYRTKRPLPQPQQPDPYAELKAAHAAGMVIQYLNHGGYFSDFPAYKEPEFLMSPEKYRIKPEQQKVPLGSDDVPPGTVLRGAGEAREPDHKGWCMITSSSLRGIRLWYCSGNTPAEITWKTLMDAKSEIWRPTDTSWQPCYKLIDTP